MIAVLTDIPTILIIVVAGVSGVIIDKIRLTIRNSQ